MPNKQDNRENLGGFEMIKLIKGKVTEVNHYFMDGCIGFVYWVNDEPFVCLSNTNRYGLKAWWGK